MILVHMVERGAVLNQTFVDLLTVVLVAVAGVLFYGRLRSWKVPFTPSGILALLFSKEKAEGGFPDKLKTLTTSTFRDIFLLQRAGAWCDEGLHTWGRGLVLWGFLGILVMTVVNFLINPLNLTMPTTDPVRLVWDASQVAVTLGAGILLSRRLGNPNRRRITDTSTWALQLLLLLVGISGLIVDAAAQTGSFALTWPLYLIQLAFIYAFILYAPFSELAFLIWKGSLLVQKELMAAGRSKKTVQGQVSAQGSVPH